MSSRSPYSHQHSSHLLIKLLLLKMSEKNHQMASPHPEGVAAYMQTLVHSLPRGNCADGEITASANTSAARLAKRSLHPPRAVSDTSLPSSAAKEGDEYPKGWKLASITLALCCAVFVGTLVRVP